MAQSWGEHLARLINLRIQTPVLNTAAITAIPADRRAGGQLILETTAGTMWQFNSTSASAAGPTVLVPDAGTGRWLAVGAGSGAGVPKMLGVRGATAAALGAYTRTGNVITANAVGALGAQDGVTYIANERILLRNGAAGADNGPYVVTDPGGATAFVLTRIGEADASAEVVAGMMVYSAEGTLNGDEWFFLSTNDPITLNTTALTFTAIPSYADLASTAASHGASLIGVQDADGVITGTTGETALTELAKRTLALVADNAALVALTAAQRTDGSLVVQADTMQMWEYDLGSAAAASNWCVVPTDGTGRWLLATPPDGRVLPPVATQVALLALTAAQRQDGSIVEQLDDNSVWIYDLGSVLAGVTDWTVEPTDGVGCWFRVDAPRGAILDPVAGNAALIALTAADRIDGSVVVQLDTMQTWKYDLGSAAAASDWVVVPTDGTGRWLDVAHPSGGLVLPAVADNAALIALTAVDRQDGSLVVQLDTAAVWKYVIGSVEAASDWVVVPTDGVGRWLRADAFHGIIHAQVADRAAVAAIPVASRADGMVVVEDDGYTGWKFEGASAAAAAPGVIVPAAGAGRWHRDYIDSGQPMQNRLRLLGAPGAAVAGDTVVIGADTLEFNAATPPAAGTVGFIWVYNGINSLASRTNLVDAINGVIDAARITRTLEDPTAGTNTELFLAAADAVTVGDVAILSADAIGGTPTPSAVATACTESLTTGTDIWDAATCRMGALAAPIQHSRTVVTVAAADVAKGTLEVYFDFTPFAYYVRNRTTLANMEAVAVVGNSLSITLAGGAPPNIQAANVLEIHASE